MVTAHGILAGENHVRIAMGECARTSLTSCLVARAVVAARTASSLASVCKLFISPNVRWCFILGERLVLSF